MLSSFLPVASGSALNQIVCPSRIFGQASTLGSDDEVGVPLMLVADHFVACGFDDRAKHVLHPGILARQSADQLLDRASSSSNVVRKDPVSVDQLGGFAVDQSHPTDLTRALGMNDVVVDRRKVDDLGESVADLMGAIVQAE